MISPMHIAIYFTSAALMIPSVDVTPFFTCETVAMIFVVYVAKLVVVIVIGFN
jgi:hypothetical protein